MRHHHPLRIVVVVGVSSAGKTVIGRELASRLGAPFLDGDDFHPQANKDKMRSGIALTDEDRWPWLDRLASALVASAQTSSLAIGACSALKRAYRDRLKLVADEPIQFVFLAGTPDVIKGRIEARTHEYMPASLLDNQFATLEPPQADEGALTLDVEMPVARLVDLAIKALAVQGIKPTISV